MYGCIVQKRASIQLLVSQRPFTALGADSCISGCGSLCHFQPLARTARCTALAQEQTHSERVGSRWRQLRVLMMRGHLINDLQQR